MTHAKIQISILYAGLTLQVSQNEQGQDITPLKPISDLFGLDWTSQYQKMTGSIFLRNHTGICKSTVYHSSGQYREQTCILLSKVAAFLISINPNKLRSVGNMSGADSLEYRLKEWIIALDEYYDAVDLIKKTAIHDNDLIANQRATIVEIINIKNQTSEQQDRNALSQVIKQMADEIGVAYQFDLTES
jgi:P22_AR N-terminal domain